MSEFAVQDDAQADAVGNTQTNDEKCSANASQSDRAHGKKCLNEWQGVGEIDDEASEQHGDEEKADGDKACQARTLGAKFELQRQHEADEKEHDAGCADGGGKNLIGRRFVIGEAAEKQTEYCGENAEDDAHEHDEQVFFAHIGAAIDRQREKESEAVALIVHGDAHHAGDHAHETQIADDEDIVVVLREGENDADEGDEDKEAFLCEHVADVLDEECFHCLSPLIMSAKTSSMLECSRTTSG